MAALQCEFCGGKLITKAGGICECDSCGMEFDKTWVKEKIQEIKGTVKVEGTVEVQGTVKIDGPVEVKGGNTADSLIRQGYMELEDYEYEAALRFFKRAIARTPQSAEAYMGALLADYDCLNFEELEQKWTEEMVNNGYFKKARKYADAGMKQKLQVLSDKTARLKVEREAEEARIAAEKARLMQEKEAWKAADLAQRQADIELLAQQRGVILPAQNRILPIRYSRWHGSAGKTIAYWCPNGKIRYTDSYHMEPAEKVEELLLDAKKVLPCKDFWFILRYDGTFSVYKWAEQGKYDANLKYTEQVKLLPITTIDNKNFNCNMQGVIDFDVHIYNEEIAQKGLVILCVFQKNLLTVYYGNTPVYGFQEKKVSVNWPASSTIHCISRYSYSEKDSIPCRCLCKDGTVLDVEGNTQWRDVASIQDDLIISKDGCILNKRQCSEWRQIVAVSGSEYGDFTVGVRLDGSVVAAGRKGPVLQEELSEWKNIAAVYVVKQVFPNTVYAITKDGKLLVNGMKKPSAIDLFTDMDELNRLYRICQTSGGWKKIRIMEDTQKQITRIQQDIADKQRELDDLTGFLTKSKRLRLSEELEILIKEHAYLEDKYKKLKYETGIHSL